MANHELIFRGEEVIKKLSEQKIFIFGLGAIGSELANILARMGARNIAGCDKDRVEADNVLNQVYGFRECGMVKADALKGRIFNDTKVKANFFMETVTEKSLGKLLKNHSGSLFIDCFDNTASRALLKESLDECLHVGVSDTYGEVAWNGRYIVPNDAGLDICNYPQAKPLVTAVAALAAETIMEYLTTGKKLSRAFTLKDFRASGY